MQVKLSKLKTTFAPVIEYSLRVETDNELLLNPYIGKTIHFEFTGLIHCINCNAKTKKSFAQGFCYPCFINSPNNSECIIRPELCEGHLGKGRDVEWEQINHVQEHIVYLALTNSPKVGVTRSAQCFTRWMDQGAWKTLVFAKTPYRRLAGEIEVALKPYISDKTNWQRMLKNERDTTVDLIALKEELTTYLPQNLRAYLSSNERINELNYPVLHYPQKVNSINLDKEKEFKEVLVGIKGQYLIFESQRVINLRKYAGYIINWKNYTSN